MAINILMNRLWSAHSHSD